jgi:hypothetical protein
MYCKVPRSKACSKHGGEKNAYNILVGKSEGTRSLERTSQRWEDNIKIDLAEIEWGGMDWIHLA